MHTETHRAAFLILTLVACAGCDRSTTKSVVAERASPATQSSSTNPASVRDFDHFDVAEAVFRYQIDSSGQKDHVDYFFLSLDDTDPPPEFLARFKDEKPRILAGSLATTSAETGVRHKDVGGRGIIFFVRAVIWLDNDTAEVQGGYYQGDLSGSGNTYRVEKRSGKWTVVKNVMKFVS